MGKTANYGLPKWEKSDFIKMDDVNAAFGKIDETLKANADAVAAKAEAEAVTAIAQTIASSKIRRAKFGTYTGTGLSGQNHPNSVECGFCPAVLVLFRADGGQKTTVIRGVTACSSGIIVNTALYSVNIAVMGGSSVLNMNKTQSVFSDMKDLLAGSALSGAFVRGNKQALKYLPDSFAMRHPDHSKFYILLFTPEAWSLSGNVFMDLNCVYSQDEESLVNLIGHELHHSYRWGYLREKYKDSGSPVAVALSMMQSEGCADILNKFEGPYSMKDAGLFGEDVLKQMNENYYNTPKLLQKIDSLTVGYSKGTVDADVYGQVAKLPVNGGHPNGFYMATLIKHQLGLQAIADNSVEPVMFVETYNKAARKAGDEYVFTDEFVAYVKQQYKLMEK